MPTSIGFVGSINKERFLNPPKLQAEGELVIVNISEEIDGWFDGYIRSDKVKKNYGTATKLKIQTDNEMVAMLTWDYNGAGINWGNYTLESASVNLYLKSKNDVESKSFVMKAYPMMAKWREIEANWNLAKKNTSWNRPGARGKNFDYEKNKLSSVTIGKTGN